MLFVTIKVVKSLKYHHESCDVKVQSCSTRKHLGYMIYVHQVGEGREEGEKRWRRGNVSYGKKLL